MAVKSTYKRDDVLDQIDEFACKVSPLYTNATLDSIDVQLKTIVNQNRAIIGILRDILNVEFHS